MRYCVELVLWYSRNCRGLLGGRVAVMQEWKWVASIWQMWEAKFRAARPKNTMRLISPFLLARKTKLLRLVAIGLGQAATTVGISLIIRDVFDSVGSHRGHRPSLF